MPEHELALIVYTTIEQMSTVQPKRFRHADLDFEGFLTYP